MKIEPTEAIKEQIEQKAREYANSQFKKGYVEGKPNFTCVDLDFAYRAGAEAAIEIANTWISVKDALPEDFSDLEDITVLIMDENGNVLQERRVYDDVGGEEILYCWFWADDNHPTHWMFIPELKQRT